MKAVDGIYPFWKPKGPTSHRFITEIKKLLGREVRVGHAGTLDPLAEGILVVGIGRGTKMLEREVGKEKEYEAEVTLGVSSSTDDAEGEKTTYSVINAPTPDEMSAVLRSFIGEIDQVPPPYSAVKIGGKEAYKLARKGLSPDMKPRRVKIISIDLIDYSYPKLMIKVVTGKGVYIRSLARDIGSRLGVGGYLSSLKRIRVGGFDADSAHSVESFGDAIREGRI